MDEFRIINNRGNFFLNESDSYLINKFNEKNKGTKFEILTGLLPEPFIGNPEKAKLLFLALNPGYKGGESDGEFKWHSDSKFSKLIYDNLDLLETDYPYYYLNEDDYFKKSPGHEWCKRVFRELINVIGAKELSKKIVCIQYHAYHSNRYKKIDSKLLSSQEIVFPIIHSFMRSGLPIVIMRSKKIWVESISNLAEYQNKIILKNPRNPTISKGNMSEGEFNYLLDLLK